VQWWLGGVEQRSQVVEVTEQMWVVARMVVVEKESICLLMMCMFVPSKCCLCGSV